MREDDPVPERPSRLQPGRARWADAALSIAEDGLYVGIAVLLVVSAAVLLVVAVDELLDVFGGLGPDPVVDVLDNLLLLFIVVELLFAVRVTITKRELVAEPFLLVGIIASIKEIVVLSVKAAEAIGRGPVFRDQLWEIAVLAGVVVLLGTTAWLLRRKEREPQEGHLRTGDHDPLAERTGDHDPLAERTGDHDPLAERTGDHHPLVEPTGGHGPLAERTGGHGDVQEAAAPG
jgi:uncharacterized membrane protein (DUF373 family)